MRHRNYILNFGGWGLSMAHVNKYTRGAIGQLCQHYERKQDEKGQYIKFGNQDIDLSRTHENYNLAPDRGRQIDFIKERCHELKCFKRADVNVMATWIVTLPKDFPKEKEKEFFEQSYNFLSDRYGEKNVISAYVHKDEKQPHMHFAFVPVVYDQKKSKEKVSAKECISKKDLLTFHKDLSKHLEKHFGRDVGILNEATREGNRSIDELKKKSAVEQLKEVEHKTAEMLHKTEEQKQVLEAKQEALKRQIDALENIKTCSYEIDKIQGKKTLIGDNVTVQREQFEKLKELAKKSVVLERKIELLEMENKNLNSDLSKYKGMDTKLKEIDNQRKIINLTKQLEGLVKYLTATNQIEKVKEYQKSLGKVKDFER